MLVLDKNEEKSTSQSLVTISVLLLIIGLGGAYHFILPNLQTSKQQYNQLYAQNKAIVENISQLVLAKQKMSVAKLALTESGVDLNKVDEVIPITEDMPGLYLQMENIISRASFLTTPIYQLSPPILVVGGVGAKIPVTISASGKYADLKQFILMFEVNIRPVSFSSINFSPVTTLKGTNDLYTLSAIGYVRSQGVSSAYTVATNNTIK